MGSAKILGKTIAVDFIYTGHTMSASIAVKAKVGSRYIATVISANYNICKSYSN